MGGMVTHSYRDAYGFLLSRVSKKTKHRVLILDQETLNLTVTIVDWTGLELVNDEDLNTLMTSDCPKERRLAELVYEQYWGSNE